jgi:Fungal specific transcription factor domain
MKAILALSVRQLSLNPGNARGPQDRNVALQYYNETLSYVQKAMQYDNYNTSLELLVTCLIISAYEMLDGSRRDWERHLKGVFWIQRSRVIHGDSNGLEQGVWWAWLCQDMWAAFKEKRKAFTFWKPSRSFAELNPHELAARSVYVMAQAVNYCSQDEINAGKGQIKARIEKADSLTKTLDDWRNALTIEFTPLPHNNRDHHYDFEPIWINPPSFGNSAPFSLLVQTFANLLKLSQYNCIIQPAFCYSSIDHL